MQAAIDVGSNTVRMLIGECVGRQIRPVSYHRKITRLGGGYIEKKGLAPESMQRTLSALIDFRETLHKSGVDRVRAVGTAALRRAENSADFLDRVAEQIGLNVEIVSGEDEARLTALGTLAVIDPLPESSLILDVGGGSSELILSAGDQLLFHHSYPVGVVRLCEESVSEHQRQEIINQLLDTLTQDLKQCGHAEIKAETTQLIGTAGTITTLAAMSLKMTEYDRRKINNLSLSKKWLQKIRDELLPLSVVEREQLPGLEKGRGDLILPGLQLLISLMNRYSWTSLKASDSGLLEGILLETCQD